SLPQPQIESPNSDISMLEPQEEQPSLQELAPEQVGNGFVAGQQASAGQQRLGSDGEFAGDYERVPRRSLGRLIRIAAMVIAVAAVGGAGVWLWPNVSGLINLTRAPDTDGGRDTGTNSRPKITDRIEPGGQQTPQPQTPPPGGNVAPT